MISYEDFDLRLRADGDGFAVSARSGSSVASETFEIDWSHPWELGELEKHGRDVVRQRGADLFDAVICGRIRDLYQRARGRAGGGGGLRIRIQVDPRDQRLRPLLLLPWELVFDRTADGGNFLAFDRRRAVVRVIDCIEPPADPAPGPVQRVLLALSNPADSDQLELQRESDEIKSALAQVHLSPVVLDKTTRSSLFESISDFEPQVVHFMGHGIFDEKAGEGALLLEDDFGLEDPLSASALAASFVGKPIPRLVVLSACLTATSGTHACGPFAAMAVALVAAGLPAVIAMQSEVLDRNAVQFTSRLYRRLVRGDPIEAAVADARAVIGTRRTGKLDWAAPVLFVRAQGRTSMLELRELSHSLQPASTNCDVQYKLRAVEHELCAIEQELEQQRYSRAVRMAQELSEKLAAPDSDAVRLLLRRMFESLSEAPTNGFVDHLECSRRAAPMLFAQAEGEAGRDVRKAMSVYDEIYSRFRDIPDVSVQEQVSRALIARVDQGWRSLRDPAVDAVADVILARRARLLSSTEDVSRALLVKAEIRVGAFQFTEALPLLDEVITAGASTDTLARARVCRAKALAGLRRIAAALAQLADVVPTLHSQEPADAENALDAYTLQASLLEELNRGEEALRSLDSACCLLVGLEGETSPLTFRARLMKAAIAERLGRTDTAASEYRNVVERASGATPLAAYASQALRSLRRLHKDERF